MEEHIIENQDNERQDSCISENPMNMCENALNDSIDISKKHIKRRWFTRSIWVIAIISSIILKFCLEDFYAMLAGLSLIAFSTMFNILSTYILIDSNFSLGAYVVIVISYMIAFSEIIIFILETGISITQDVNEAFYFKYVWYGIYYCSMGFNFVLIQFLWVYWQQGHPSFFKRIIAVFRYYFKILILILVIILILLIFVLVRFRDFIFKKLEYEMILLTIQVLNLIYCMIFYIMLFCNGLIALPEYFFLYTNTAEQVKNHLIEMKSTGISYGKIINKYKKDAQFLKDLCNELLILKNELPSDTIEYCQTILKHINHYSEQITFSLFAPENDTIQSHFAKEDIRSYQINILADMFMKYKSYVYLYQKKERMLLRTYYQLRDCLLIDNASTIIYKNDKTKEERQVIGHKNEYEIHLKEYSICTMVCMFVLGLLFVFLSLLFYLIQVIIPFIMTFFSALSSWEFLRHKDYFFAYTNIIFIYFIYVTLCCFYSLTQFKKLEDYTLVVHHTDKYGMLNNAAMLNTIVFGIAYNICFFFNNSDTWKTNISSAFLFISPEKHPIIYQGIIWGYPSFITIFLIIFLFRRNKCKCQCEEKESLLANTDDEDSMLQHEDIKKEKTIINSPIKESMTKTHNKHTFIFGEDNQFNIFIENFERSYFKEIINTS